MAHWAEIDSENKVIRVLVGDNNDANGDEGHQWLIKNLGGTWIKTSYNGKIRKQFAGIGYSYDPIADVFIIPQPFPSWKLNKNYDWEAPVPYPNDGLVYIWDEQIGDWLPYVQADS